MSDLVTDAVERLRRSGVKLARRLSDDEIARIEETFAFSFGSEHRTFLAAVLPIGERWVDWRTATGDEIHARLEWPVDGVIFDIHHNGFWPSSWGQRPTDLHSAERQARERLRWVPKLVPIYSHRYLPAAPAPVPSPVLSVYQTDVIYYGDNLLDYVAHEFGLPPLHPAGPDGVRRIAFWSDLAEGAESRTSRRSRDTRSSASVPLAPRAAVEADVRQSMAMALVVTLRRGDSVVRGLPDPTGGTFDAAGDFDSLVGSQRLPTLGAVDPYDDTTLGGSAMPELLIDLRSL